MEIYNIIKYIKRDKFTWNWEQLHMSKIGLKKVQIMLVIHV